MTSLLNSASTSALTFEQAADRVHAVIAQFDLDFASRRIKALAEAYRHGLPFAKGEAPTQQLVSGLIQRQIPPAGPSDNAFLPIIRAFTGQYDPNPDAKKVSYQSYSDLTPFIRNTSWEKYAGVLRWAYLNEIDPDRFEGWVREFKDDKDRTGLNAILLADRAKHGKAPRKRKPKLTGDELQKLVEEARTMPRVSIAAPTGSTKGEWAVARVWVEDGMLYYAGLVSDSADAALKLDVTPLDVEVEELSPEMAEAVAKQEASFAALREKGAA